MRRTVLVIVALTAGASAMLGLAVGYLAGGGGAIPKVGLSPIAMSAGFDLATPIDRAPPEPPPETGPPTDAAAASPRSTTATEDPTPTSTLVPTATPVATATATLQPTATITPVPTATGTPEPLPTATPSPTVTVVAPPAPTSASLRITIPTSTPPPSPTARPTEIATPSVTVAQTPTPTIEAEGTPPATSNPAASGLTIVTMNAAGHPLPGACFSVTLGLQGTEVQPELAHLDLSALRAGLVVVEVCDAGDGRLDGVLTVGGAVANVVHDIAEALDAPDVNPELVRQLDGPTLTIDLIQTRSPASEGGATSNQPLPRIAMTLTGLGSGERVRVVYGAADSPVTLNPGETPPPSDGTGVSE